MRLQIFLLLFAQMTFCIKAQWVDPYIVAADGVTVIQNDNNKFIISIDENIKPVTNLGKLTYPDGSNPTLNDDFDAVKIEKTDKSFMALIKFDYEQKSSYTGFIVAGFQSVEYEIKINNLNDNPITIRMSGDCNVKEEMDPHETNCDVIIEDDDGFSKNLKIKLPKYNDIFQFACESGCLENVKSETAVMSTLAKLDFETIRSYIFDLIVDDEEMAASLKIEVKVVDIADMPPTWKSIFGSQSLDECDSQTFTVSAVDGDRDIDADIEYECTHENAEVTCTTDNINKQCIINVEAIDRDKDDITKLEFSVTAYEKDNRRSNITEEIIFIIRDLNNNVPNITIDKEELSFDENKYEKLSDKIAISAKDGDQGLKGSFKMSLHSDTVPNIDKIFQIIPDNAYRSGVFSLTIINSEELNYENKDMRNFNLKIKAIETEDPNHTHEVSIAINLLNWNDEIPKFSRQDSKYDIQIPETFGRGGPEYLPNLEDLVAVDADVNDFIEYKLVGSGSDRILELQFVKDTNNVITLVKILTVQQENGVQLFDFENGPTVQLQLEAVDTLDVPVGTPKHRVYADLNIHLTDVNDETPTITMNKQSVRINENLKTGTKIDELIVRGEDRDADSVIKFDIDWSKSYATKYGQRVDDDFKDYKGCFDLQEITGTRTNSKEANIVINEKVKNNTPNYELFDTIYLYVYVEDTHQNIGIKTSEAILIVNVDDFNDEKPVFVPELLQKPKKIKENSNGVPIGTISATDKDTNEKLIYSLKPINNTSPNLVEIDENTGDISSTERGVGEIDAEENGGVYYLYYKITVTDKDEVHSVSENFEILVIDENDKSPTFLTNLKDISIKEHMKVGDLVLEVKAFDEDRDDPNNKISYTLENPQAQKYLQIDDRGKITIRSDMDREGDDPIVLVEVLIKDNPDDIALQKTDKQEFKVILVDINDKKPIITSDTITTKENLKIGEKIDATITATDRDDPASSNSQMEIEILEVVDNGNKLDVSFFDIATAPDKGTTTATITVLKDLRKYFGEYTIKMKVTDKGNDPLSSTKDVTLVIEKYNFEPAKFTFPVEGKSIYLKPDQQVDEGLLNYMGEPLEFIKAEHEVPNKYKIKYSIEEDGVESKTFKMTENGEMLLKSVPTLDSYLVTFIAKDEGVPPLTAELQTTIGFYDQKDEPTYSGTREETVCFKETAIGVGHPKPTAEAKYKIPPPGELQKEIYYFINSGNGNKAFKCDKATGNLELVKPLFVLNNTETTMTILATGNPKGNSDPKPESVLTVNLELIDVNDNAPVFDQKEYFAGIMTSYDKDKVILQVKATDLDEDPTLTYTIDEDTLEANGNGISVSNKFKLHPHTGDIKLDFEVKENMDGHFIFKVDVTDGVWDTETTVKIYIVVISNLVSLVFENEVKEVDTKKTQIEEILGRAMNYRCTVQSIAPLTGENGLPIPGNTEVKANFIDPSSNLPVDKELVMSSLYDVNTFGQLKSAFLTEALSFHNVIEPKVEEPKGETLQMALIGVSVVLGTACILLVIGFILKTRSLTGRINKLSRMEFTSDESLDVAAAPNTNRRAVEGSNPVFNTETVEKEMPGFDNQSLSSTDSDLIGVENNDFFMN